MSNVLFILFYPIVLYCVALTFGWRAFLGAHSSHHGHGGQATDGSHCIARFLSEKKKQISLPVAPPNMKKNHWNNEKD